MTTFALESEVLRQWVTPDAWLGEILGKPAFNLRVIDPAVLDEAVDALPVEGLVTTKVSADDVSAGHALEELGFRLVATQLRLASSSVSAHATDVGVEFASADDEDRVADVAGRAFAYSRFHTDPAIRREVADRIKREWARAFFTGARGDFMIVARDAGSIIGFLQLFHRDERLVIDLIGIAEDHRGRGVGAALIAFAAEHCRPYGVMDVGTQAANVPSLRLYMRLGFRPYEAANVFHLHRG